MSPNPPLHHLDPPPPPICYFLLKNFVTVLSEVLNMPHLRIETNVKSADIKVRNFFV
jgi:hypothetical protein